MPTPTDLVTDLPADFEVFGQAVDTSMADLKGGTTGQILSKATNTDMDFTWITNDVGDITAVNVTAPITGGGTSGAVTIGVSAASTAAAGVVQLSDSTSTTSSVLASTPTATKSAYDLAAAAIAKSTVTTAGDVIYRNATVPTRLGIGTAGQVLTVNSGATAPEWATVAAGGWTLASTTTLSGTSTSINIPSGYRQIVIFGVNYYGDSGYPFIRLNSSSSGIYAFVGQKITDTTLYNEGEVSATSFRLGIGGAIKAGQQNNNFTFIMYNQDSTAAYKAVECYDNSIGSSDQVRFDNYRGVFKSLTAVTTIQIQSNNNLSGGTVYVYGVK
jgi:hypothetical protein